MHLLNTEWTLYIHLAHDTDWSISSYKNICKVNKLDDLILLVNNFSQKLLTNSMVFFMRDDISPCWEDPKNINGGSISFKILNKNVYDIWKNMVFRIIGETLYDEEIQSKITGITVSPKKNFCIIKIWFNSCDENIVNSKISNMDELNDISTIFKKHM